MNPELDLPDLQARLGDCSPVLIGALALERLGVMPTRGTLDADVVVRCDQAALAPRLGDGWRRRSDHRWVAPRGTPIDLVACSDRDLERGVVEFPSGSRMSLVGMRHLWSRPRVSVGLGVGAGAAAVLFLLKVVAHQERPHERRKDLGDVAAILEGYLPLNDDRRYLGAAADRGLFQEEAGAWWLGRELAALVDEVEAALLRDFVSDAREGMLAEHMASRAPASWRRSPDVARRRLQLFLEGLG